MTVQFKPSAHQNCYYPAVIECKADVKEWIALEPEYVEIFQLNVENGFCDNYPEGTKQCISMEIQRIRKYDRFKHRAIYITLPRGSEI